MISSKRTSGRNEEASYPKLVVHKSNDLIVLAMTSKHGVTLSSNAAHEIGELLEPICIANFKDYTGTVELSND